MSDDLDKQRTSEVLSPFVFPRKDTRLKGDGYYKPYCQTKNVENRPKIETWLLPIKAQALVALEYNKECILYLEPFRSDMNYDERKSAKEAITKTH